MRNKKTSKSERGYVLMFWTLMLVTAVGFMGLAVDTVILNIVKTRLQSAVDGAAVAGARSLARGADVASQRANALAVENDYYLANFPDGMFGTARQSLNKDIVDISGTKVRQATVSATVRAPLYFLTYAVGSRTADVTAQAVASRRDVNIMMVLDRSGSLTSTNSCTALKNAAAAFVDNFAPGRDKVGLLTFGGSDLVDIAPTVNFTTSPNDIKAKVNSIACNGATGTPQALWHAYQQLTAINESGALNVILVFTDGLPNALTASWPILATSTCTSKTAKLGFINVSTSNSLRGIRATTASAIPVSADPNQISDSAGCYFASSIDSVNQDLAYIPEMDAFSNDTDNGYQSVTRYSSGTYSAKIQPTYQNLINAAFNAADDAANRIRTGTLPVTIFTIGLGGASDAAPDEFLRRMANDPSAGNYHSTQTTGLYLYSPTSTDLQAAFSRIGSEVARLSQ